jgi:hypothetical protein
MSAEKPIVDFEELTGYKWFDIPPSSTTLQKED